MGVRLTLSVPGYQAGIALYIHTYIQSGKGLDASSQMSRGNGKVQTGPCACLPEEGRLHTSQNVSHSCSSYQKADVLTVQWRSGEIAGSHLPIRGPE